MSVFRKLNRKQKHEFNKLDKQKQIDIVTNEITSQSRKKRSEVVARAFIDGYLFASYMLYEHHLKNFENASDLERKQIMVDIVAEIAKNNDKYKENHDLKEKIEEITGVEE